MLEARLAHASVLKKLLDAVRILVNEANFDFNDTGLTLQAMDTSHVALVCLMLRAGAFEHYRCDRNMTIGMNLQNLSVALRAAGPEDVLTLRADTGSDALGLLFEGKNDRVCEYALKLMDIDSEHLGIPDADYDATVTMSSAEFQRICRDLLMLSESVTISVTKEGVQFVSEGDMGAGSINLKNGSYAGSVDEVPEAAGADDGDEDMDSDEVKREAKGKAAKGKGKAGAAGATDAGTISTTINLMNPVSMQFSLKYLVSFTKATSLAPVVSLCLTDDVPMMVEYKLEDVAQVRYFLAPKIGEEEEGQEAE